jgi:hypothetical protein
MGNPATLATPHNIIKSMRNPIILEKRGSNKEVGPNILVDNVNEMTNANYAIYKA